MASLPRIQHGQPLCPLHALFRPNRYNLHRVKKFRKQVGVPIVRSSVQKQAGQGSFIKPLDFIYPQLPCRICRGRRKIVCDRCDGKGKLGKGGYHKKNPVCLDRIVGSKWTVMETTFGWRHFIVHTKQRGSAKDWFLEMVATCDKNTHFWINAKNLKDRESWSMGWLQREELLSGYGKSDVSLCKACRGEGRLACTACDVEDSSKPNKVDIIEV